VAKAAASVDAVSGGRFLLGLASGDCRVEFPAFGVEHATRGETFRAGCESIDRSLQESFPDLVSPFGVMRGNVDLIPKPAGGRLPMIAIGSAQQSVQWIAEHADAWVSYPRDIEAQRAALAFGARVLNSARRRAGSRSPNRFSLT